MASGLITSWKIDGETVETVTDFIFWDFKITVDGDCRHKIRRPLLLGRKAMTNLVQFSSVAQSCPTLCNPITFLPGSKCLLISWLQSPSAVILESQKIKSVTVSIVSPYICHEVMGPDAMILVSEC